MPSNHRATGAAVANRADVLAEARRWIGTPFHHQACVRGHGVDCAHLIIGVGVELRLMEMLSTEDRRYGRVPRPEHMRKMLNRYMDPVNGDPRPGDVFYSGWRAGRPMHLGFMTDLPGLGMLHASSHAGRVVETSFPAGYDLLIDSWWLYRGLAE